MNLISKALIKLIRLYQKGISPRNISCCRFTPTCSQYAVEAITVHGAVKGILLSIWRIMRCNPLCKGGYDPVPDRKKWRSVKK